MAKRSDLQRLSDHIDGQIADLQRTKDAIAATLAAITRVKPKAPRKPKVQEPTS